MDAAGVFNLFSLRYRKLHLCARPLFLPLLSPQHGLASFTPTLSLPFKPHSPSIIVLLFVALLLSTSSIRPHSFTHSSYTCRHYLHSSPSETTVKRPLCSRLRTDCYSPRGSTRTFTQQTHHLFRCSVLVPLIHEHCSGNSLAHNASPTPRWSPAPPRQYGKETGAGYCRAVCVRDCGKDFRRSGRWIQHRKCSRGREHTGLE